MDVDPAAAALVQAAQRELAAACRAVADAQLRIPANPAPEWRSVARGAFDERLAELAAQLDGAADALQRALAAAHSALSAGVGCGTGNERVAAPSAGGVRFSPDGMPLLEGIR